jgi:hypothetical protein
MIKTGKELAAACMDVAQNYKTLYVLGAFGWPMTADKKQRAKNAQSYNSEADRAAKINAASADTFGFDCVCLIKALLWGWDGSADKPYGGAVYGSNGVPDISDSGMIEVCTGVSTDFSNIQVGEAVWMNGHIGIYIGNGLAVECTPIWKDGVQITACNRDKAGYHRRDWVKHGKLPYVTYGDEEEEKPAGDAVELPMLRSGSKGETVLALQRLLIGNGYSCGRYGADGDFGAETNNAVRLYQRDNGLEVDGICGKLTWSKLLGV